MLESLDRFKTAFNQLNKDTLHLLEDIYTPDVRFRDPVHELNGLPALRDYYSRLYEGVLSCRFEFEDEVIVGQQECWSGSCASSMRASGAARRWSYAVSAI